MSGVEELVEEAERAFRFTTVPSPNASATIRLLGRDRRAVLEAILSQAAASRTDHSFWRLQLQNTVLARRGEPLDADTVQQHLRRLRDTTVVLAKARQHLRTHPGNPEWAVSQLCHRASDWCDEGALEPTSGNLHAALYAGIITDSAFGNHDGHNNELLVFMADRIDLIESDLHRFDGELRLAELTALYDTDVALPLVRGML